MTIDLQILTAQLQKFFMMILMGFLARKSGLLTDELHDKLNTTIMRVVVPALLIGNMACAGGSESAKLVLPMTLGAFVVFCVLFVFGRLSGHLLGFHGDQLKAQTGLMFVGSTGFFGIPLISALLGTLGTTAFGLFSVADNITVWTFGLAMSRGETENKEKLTPLQLVKHVMQPATVSVFVGLFLLAVKFPSDSVLITSLTTIGSCSNPLAMLCIGSSIARSDLKTLLGSWKSLSIVALRMCLVPVLVYKACMLLSVYQPAAVCLAMVTAMPSSSMFALMCKDNGNTAAQYASGAAVVTVLCSLFTLPFVAQFLV